jgi:hypothetical protein
MVPYQHLLMPAAEAAAGWESTVAPSLWRISVPRIIGRAVAPDGTGNVRRRNLCLAPLESHTDQRVRLLVGGVLSGAMDLAVSQ